MIVGATIEPRYKFVNERPRKVTMCSDLEYCMGGTPSWMGTGIPTREGDDRIEADCNL
jgi:hypothetical protein